MSKFEDEYPHSFDEDTFANATQGVKPLKQDKIHFGKAIYKQNKQTSLNKYQQDRTSDNKPNLKSPPPFHFSEQYEPLISTSQPLNYVKDGYPAYYTKLLRRSDVRPEIILDLHGYNKEQAKYDLGALIQECKIKQIPCACVVHGVGGGILKTKLPHYLIQHPDVIALHQAPLEWGGQGAIVFIINLGEDLEYLLNR